jgi:putative transposase
MKVDTKQRRNARKGFAQLYGTEELAERMVRVLQIGKKGLDSLVMELGRMLAETIMDMEREERSGPEGKPLHEGVYKWAYQKGSIYCGDQKIRVNRPRLRGPQGEMALATYDVLKRRGAFSEELLARALRGISGRRYRETVIDTASALGVSPSSISRHFIEATATKLREFKERDLSGVRAFAVFIDTVHRGKEAFMVALGIDDQGRKAALGFWQGASENHEICEELLSDLERRGLHITKKTLFVTDGGKGVIKALRDRFGVKLLHQRCIIHKDRNIQRHLAKKYRKEAHRRFMGALQQNLYEDAKKMLLDFSKWLRALNESAADSLNEALEEILTVHRLNVPLQLRKTLSSTNPIENMFSTVRDCEVNIKRYRGSAMSQRWLASVIFYCERGFRRIKGYDQIAGVLETIERVQGSAVSAAA